VAEGWQSSPTAASDAVDRTVGFDVLRRTGLFRDIPLAIIERIAAALRPVDIPAGGTVLEQGGRTDRFYVIESGTVVVSAKLGETDRELARLGPGDFFGEIALLHGGESAASVHAETPARLLALTAQEFQALMEQVPPLRAGVEQIVQRRKAQRLADHLEVEHHNIATLLEGRGEIRIGRAPDNDLVFTAPTVSRYHAVIRLDKGRCLLTDLSSTSGTYVDGAEIRGTVELQDGAEVSVSDQRFIFDRTRTTELIEPRGIRVDVVGISKQIGDHTLLHDISLTVHPGELVAIVGGSGAGKTTLMDALSGVRQATSGRVLYDGSDYYAELGRYRHALGYVPQDDILHLEMPLRLTLRYSARLRLPRDTSSEAIDEAVDSALQNLNLMERADIRVGKLSGGQRKRASIGIELLSEPRILYLDEPTSGLDPSTERHMMELLRSIASEGRTVVLTTHATANVRLCDKIAVLAQDGYLAFFGTPDEALRHFDVSHFDEIYDRVTEEGTPVEWAERFRASAAHVAIEEGQPVRPPRGAQPAKGGRLRPRGLAHALHQLRVLSHRNFDLYARHPSNFVPLVMQPVVFTLLLLALFRSHLFSTKTSNPNAPLQLLYIFSFMVFLFGLLFGVQEIVKERAVFRRERMVNVGIVPYLLSKTSFLAPLLVVCTLAMTVILWLTHRLPNGGLHLYLALIVTLSLTAFAGLCLALFISAAVNSSQLATDLLTPWIAPQVLFAGALFAVAAMNSVGKVIAAVTAVRWSFEGSVSSVHLKHLFAQIHSPIAKSLQIQYRDSFNWAPHTYWLVLAAFILVPLIGAGVVLARKTRPS
jgi:ABC-type multidrug transport system ATPase subunit/CRP-like cAMP-binding protein